MNLSIQNYSKTSQQLARKILKYYPKEVNQSQRKLNEKPYLHMHDHRKEREIFERTTSQKLQTMELFRKEGNNLFNNKKYSQASYYYNKIIVYSDYTFPSNQQQQSKMDSLVQLANINLGMTLIKLKQPTKAQMHLKEGIKGTIPKQVSKAYYWLTKISIQKGQFKKAVQYISKLKELHMIDCQKQVQQLSVELKMKKINQQSKRRHFFSNILSH